MFSLPVHQRKSLDSAQALGQDSPGRSAMPPALQLKAAPIQRVHDGTKSSTKTKDTLTVDDIEKEAQKQGFVVLDKDSLQEIDLDKFDIGVDEFLSQMIKEGIVGEPEIEDEEPCEDELKSFKKIRTGAPKGIFESVYKPDKSNPNFEKVTKKDSKEFYEFKCFSCNEPLLLEKSTMHEEGFKKGSKEKEQKPPVCHSDEFPADYTTNAIEEIYQEKTGIKDLSAIRITCKKTTQKAHWNFKKELLGTGHTKCNSSHKDKSWKMKSSKEKKEYKEKTLEYLKSLADDEGLSIEDYIKKHQ